MVLKLLSPIRIGVWRKWLAHLADTEEVLGSNPSTPTKLFFKFWQHQYYVLSLWYDLKDDLNLLVGVLGCARRALNAKVKVRIFNEQQIFYE